MLSRLGTLPPFNPEALLYFFVALVFLFIGKCFFSWLVLRWKIKINYVRKLGLRPWKKLAAFVIPLVITKGETVITDWIVLFSVGALTGLLTESYWGKESVADSLPMHMSLGIGSKIALIL